MILVLRRFIELVHGFSTMVYTNYVHLIYYLLFIQNSWWSYILL